MNYAPSVSAKGGALTQSVCTRVIGYVCPRVTLIPSRRGYARLVETQKSLLPHAPVRVRFAPSPTGYLHLGSLRTALYNYLLAKRTGGQFILRVEDTDQKRVVADAEQRLYQDLKWAGLTWDEGADDVGGPHAPYKQSERTSIYKDHIQILLDSRDAFRCFCSPSHATTVQNTVGAGSDQLAQSISGCQEACDELAPEQISERLGESHVVRFRRNVPAPSWRDLVYGKIEISKKSPSQGRLLADAVLVKTDGTPTYHLANVIDDHLMKISHVIRGTEWMSSTALHVALYNAFGWTPPQFAHVGLLTDAEGNKLSKRRLDTDLRSLYEQHDVLPETVVNFLALLGWRNPGSGDVMTLDQMSNLFDLKFTRGNAIVSLDKLWFLQRQHARSRILKAAISRDGSHDIATESGDFDLRRFHELVDRVSRRAERAFPDVQKILSGRSLVSYAQAVLFSDPEYYMNSKQYLERNAFFFTRESTATSAPEVDTSSAVAKIAARVLEDQEIKKFFEIWNDPRHLSAAELASKIRGGAAAINDAISSLCREEITASAGQDQDGSREGMTASAGRDQDGNKLAKAMTKQVHDYFRRLLTFGSPSPSTGHVMLVLGRDEVNYRMAELLRSMR